MALDVFTKLNECFKEAGRMSDELLLNRYRLISKAGSGGFATVFVAWDTRIKRRVAIKCIQLQDEPIGEASTKVPGLEEAQTAALLSDASIVGVYDFEVSDGVAYLIMEYVDGVSLSTLLREYHAEIDTDIVAAIFTSVAHALEVAHNNQVLHLDIKPDNILISRQGDVKVTDFGLATLSDSAGFGQAGGGTIGYMPLEQMRLESLDERCDEWALASITYEMIAGANPFRAANLERAEKAIEDAELALPSLVMDGIDPAADDIIFYALDPDREERYESVAEFADELEECLGSARQGRKKLAHLVGDALRDDEPEEKVEQQRQRRRFESWRRRDHMPRISWDTLMRCCSVVGVGALAGVCTSLLPMPGGWTSPFTWLVFLAPALLAAFVPSLGVLCSLALLVALLWVQQALIASIVVALGALAWWFLLGRHGKEEAAALSLSAGFGLCSFFLVTPFVLGGLLRIRAALLSLPWTLALMVIFASLGFQPVLGWELLANGVLPAGNIEINVPEVLLSPLFWSLGAGMLLATLIISWVVERDTLPSVVLGVPLGSAVLIGSCVLGMQLDPIASTFADGLTLYLSAGGAGLVGLILALLERRFVCYDYDHNEELD